MSSPAVALRFLCARACTPTCTFHMPDPHLPLFDRPSYAMPCVRRARYRCTDYDMLPFSLRWQPSPSTYVQVCPPACEDAISRLTAEYGCCFTRVWEPILKTAKTTLRQIFVLCSIVDPCGCIFLHPSGHA